MEYTPFAGDLHTPHERSQSIRACNIFNFVVFDFLYATLKVLEWVAKKVKGKKTTLRRKAGIFSMFPFF
jgi:hypothetical protein